MQIADGLWRYSTYNNKAARVQKEEESLGGGKFNPNFFNLFYCTRGGGAAVAALYGEEEGVGCCCSWGQKLLNRIN